MNNNVTGGSKQTTLCYEKFSHASQERDQDDMSQQRENANADSNEIEVDKTRDKTFQNDINDKSISINGSPADVYRNLESAMADLHEASIEQDIQEADKTRNFEETKIDANLCKKSVGQNQIQSFEPMFETIKEEGQSFMESHTEKNINNIVRQSELSDEQFCSQDLASYLHTQGLQNTLAIT